jgi:TetR/AcrR family transcriptional regulator
MVPRPAAAPRRDRLLATAIDLFTRYGVRRTSIEDVAAATRVAKGAVYLEFASKDELFRAAAGRVIEDIVGAATAAATRPGPLVERVTDLLAAKFWRLHDLVHTRPHARELIDAKDAVAADLFRAADARYAALLVDTLAAARASWRPRRPYRVAEVAAVLLRAAHGTGYAGPALTAAAFRARLRLAVRLILAGAAARGTG